MKTGFLANHLKEFVTTIRGKMHWIISNCYLSQNEDGELVIKSVHTTDTRFVTLMNDELEKHGPSVLLNAKKLRRELGFQSPDSRPTGWWEHHDAIVKYLEQHPHSAFDLYL